MKVLIISHPPMATYNNMGKTFLSLFSCFEKDELCQLYIYPSYPNRDACSSYFRVTDKEVLRSFLGKRKIGAEVDRERIRDDQGAYEHEEDRAFYRSRKNKSAFRRLMRDAMWRFSPWYGKDLKTWLDREQPDCIFVAPGVAKFLYDMALRIAKDRKLPIVSYICDEYYFVKKPDQLLDRVRLRLLQKKMEQLMQRSNHLVVISEELKTEYAAHFGVETSVIMTGADSVPAAAEEQQAPGQLCYFGNIRCNRYHTLAEIGRELESINRERGTDYRLKIYTGEQDPAILRELQQIAAVDLCGFVTGEAYGQAVAQAQLLLHTEAFDEASMDFTRHSVSTKIAEALASGIPLVAYGPEELSSIRHLLRHRCALVATSRDELRDVLLTALEDEQARTLAVNHARHAAEQLHDSERNSRLLHGILLAASEM